MTKSSEELTAFVKKYERLAKSKVRSFLAHNPRHDAQWLGEDLLQSAYMGIVLAFQTYDKEMGVPEHAYVSLKIEFAILQDFDRENPVSARTIAKLRKYQDDKAKVENLYRRPITHAEYAEWDLTSDKQLSDFLLSAMVQVMPVDDEILQNRHFHNGSLLDKFILRKEIMAVIRKAIAKMSKREKIIIKSLYIDGKSLRETGEIIGIRKQSVAGARDKILAKIRKNLEEVGVEV